MLKMNVKHRDNVQVIDIIFTQLCTSDVKKYLNVSH